MMSNLISMVDFVLDEYDKLLDAYDSEQNIFEYAKFLKQPLELWMFDKDDERCLFEGFEYKKELRNSGGNYTHILKKEDIEIYIQRGGFHLFGKYELKTIEDLIPYNLKTRKWN